MTETPPEPIAEASVPDEATTRTAVYDEAELRFVDAVPDETSKQTAARLNKDNQVGRADGSRGNRYTVRKV